MIKKRKKLRKKPVLSRRFITLEIFPAIFSLLNAFFGFLSIIEAIKGRFKTSAILILLSWLMDIMDGFVARSLKATSFIGIQLDSLSDSISFGLAPSLLIYSVYLKNIPQGWIIPFIYCTSGVIRLARYNVLVMSEHGKSSYFTGLPIPASAILLSGLVLLFKNEPFGNFFYGFLSFLMLIISFLMVSRIKYPNFKYFQLMKRRNLFFVFFLSIIIAIAYVAPHFVVLSLAVPYILFPLIVIINKSLQRRTLKKEVTAEQHY
ncbi:MAG: CDP-diacylglycerol--serine O-phosphatidyltransferase [Candidatus Aminicenantia bacterium]